MKRKMIKLMSGGLLSFGMVSIIAPLGVHFTSKQVVDTKESTVLTKKIDHQFKTSSNIVLTQNSGEDKQPTSRIGWKGNRPKETIGFNTSYSYRFEKSIDGKTWETVSGTQGNGVLGQYDTLSNHHFAKFKYTFGKSYRNYQVRFLVSFDWYSGSTKDTYKKQTEISNAITIKKAPDEMVWESKPIFSKQSSVDGTNVHEYKFSFWFLEGTNLSDYKITANDASTNDDLTKGYSVRQTGTHVAEATVKISQPNTNKTIKLTIENDNLKQQGYHWSGFGYFNITVSNNEINDLTLQVTDEKAIFLIQEIINKNKWSPKKVLSLSENDKFDHFSKAFGLTRNEIQKFVESISFEDKKIGGNLLMKVDIKLKDPYKFRAGESKGEGFIKLYNYDYDFGTGNNGSGATDDGKVEEIIPPISNENVDTTTPETKPSDDVISNDDVEEIVKNPEAGTPTSISKQQNSTKMSGVSIALISIAVVAFAMGAGFILFKTFKK